MIGVISGRVIFSDGNEVIINSASGIGYQAFCRHILPEGEHTSIFISHIIRENSEDLYGFRTLREKKLFELLITVKGVGPKSAFALVSQVPVGEIVQAVLGDQKKILTQAPGIGAKAASQIILDLQNKIDKVRMYSHAPIKTMALGSSSNEPLPVIEAQEFIQEPESQLSIEPTLNQSILDDTLLACKNLGFDSERIIPLAQKILRENPIKKTEQLVHLVLKEV